jgi:hypothetical protein
MQYVMSTVQSGTGAVDANTWITKDSHMIRVLLLHPCSLITPP